MNKNTKIIKAAILITLIFACTSWYWISKKHERDFIALVQKEIQSGAGELDISKLMAGQWEWVCNINGYDGETYIKKYNKTYPASGGFGEGDWGLTFINPDGSYEAVSGSRGDGFELEFGCMSRESAKLVRKTGRENFWVPESRNGS